MIPTLYRAGSETSPNFGRIHSYDIPVIKGIVKPQTGGMSVFSERDYNWVDDGTWIVPQISTSEGYFPPVLRFRNLLGGHWVIEPAYKMSLEAFKQALVSLDKTAIRYNDSPHEKEKQDTFFSAFDLPEFSSNSSIPVRFIYMALIAVARERIHIDDLDDNDYTEIAYIAMHLNTNSGEMKLSALEYHPGELLTKQKALAALAVVAYIKQRDAECQRANDEDMEVAWFTDRALLRIALSLDNLKDHPILGSVVRTLYM
ncbi:hypothetical protein C8Q75DRAFT_733753 [Abortiporus biennis]|nr:hypothetical protein C8Q75DRAFT_733753 [Abortiporus biennis]